MKVKVDSIESGLINNDDEIISWTSRYATGIKVIDNQHRELVKLINQLHQACLLGEEGARPVYKEAMHKMVEYVRFHFTAELEILAQIKYPDYNDHKKQHDNLIRDILVAAKESKEGKKFVPNHFVRTLMDWVFGHIAIYDKRYSEYVTDLKKKGLFPDQQFSK